MYSADIRQKSCNTDASNYHMVCSDMMFLDDRLQTCLRGAQVSFLGLSDRHTLLDDIQTKYHSSYMYSPISR